MQELEKCTAIELGNKIRRKEVTVTEAVEATLAVLKKKEKVLHCYITMEEEEALLCRAGRLQQRIMSGELKGSPLAGVPMAVKDNLCTKGLRTTCGSKMLEQFVAPYHAEAVHRLCEAGAIIIGKTNMDEFAMGSTTETSAYGQTVNPHRMGHVPGGSSGGSAAAVAAGEAFYALGTDTGGSIRQPAAHCGVVGLKPTYGRVSRYGLVAYASSLEQIGPLTKDAADCAAVLDVISGPDRKDATSADTKNSCSFLNFLVKDLSGVRIGIPTDYLADGLDGEVEKAVREAAGVLKAAGAAVEEFKLGLVREAVPVYYIIASSEAGSNLARFDGVSYGYRAAEYENLNQMYTRSRTEGFGEEVKRRILLGAYALSAGFYEEYYLKAMRARRMVKEEFDQAFLNYDLILGPVAPTTAPCIGEWKKDMIKMYSEDRYTVPANLAGLPAISIPCGTDKKGLPIGLQLIGNCFEEGKLLRAAYAYECQGGRCS